MKTKFNSFNVLRAVIIFAFSFSFLFNNNAVFSQGGLAINTTGATADSSAMLDVSSTTAGVLIPRMTKAQRNLINSPSEALLIYQIDDSIGFWYYNNGVWKLIVNSENITIANGTSVGNTLYWNGSAWVESSNIYNAGASVGIGTNTPDASAKFEISSTTSGVLISRMTTNERDSIQNPAEGLQIYNLDCHNFEYYNGSSWVAVNPIIANINISANPSCIICEGTNVTFTATTINGGSSPKFQWKLNGADVGSDTNVYNNSSLKNGDQINCVLTSNSNCVIGNPAVSNFIFMHVAKQPDSADAGQNQILIGDSTTKLSANIPTAGIGTWSVISGSAVIDDINSPTAAVSGLKIPSKTTLRWTISNPPCPDTYDEVDIEVIETCKIGLSIGGGIVFYYDNINNECYVASKSNESTSPEWGCYGTSIPGTETGIGYGAQNTLAIVNSCSASNIAAQLCYDLTLNSYSDWFLPSKDELNELYNQKSVVGNFLNNRYWSSSEYDSNKAWIQYFSDGKQEETLKIYANLVRCIRKF